MRIVPLIVGILFFSATAFAAEIREFDLKTIERLGSELIRVTQRPDRGATTPVRKRAIQTAKAALRGKLFNVRYDYVVLDDPDGSGFLVYALAASRNSDEIMLGGHGRVTVSADGEKAERVDLLSRSLNVGSKKTPPGQQYAAAATSQLVSNKPVETFIYLSYLHRIPIAVSTPDKAVWMIANGKIVRIDEKGPKNALDILNRKAN
jgi:hypothetical protein